MKRNKFFKFLASLKLAVILFVCFAVILALATYFESVYDTQTAQHLVYKSPFFSLFLAVFFANIFCSTFIRYPWTKKQTGFVVTHLGILVLLLGAAVTTIGGVDGSLIVQEGQSSKRVMLNDPVFFVGRPSQKLEEIPAEFRWSLPSQQRPRSINLAEGVVAEVVEYLHHARRNTYYQESSQGVPAVEMRIFNQRVDQSQWLTAGKGDVQLGPAKIQLLRSANAEQFKQLSAAGLSQRGELQLLVAGEPLQVNVAELNPAEPMKVGNYTVTLRRYLAHAVAVDNKLISQDEHPVNPCVDVQIADAKGNSQDWLLFARIPSLNTRTASHGEALPVKILYAWDSTPDQHILSLILDPAGKLWAKVDAQAARPVVIGKPQATGWMDLQFEVTRYLLKAVEVNDFVAVEVEKGAEQNAPPPAIRLRLLGTKENQLRWLERGDVVQVNTDAGGALVVGYGFHSLELNFPIHLQKFQMDVDPGTNSPAAFKSQVEVDGQSSTIQMNEPLLKDGYKIFQSSYSQVPGQPTFSIFTVSKDPGIWLKYTGSIMLVMGIAIMFLTRRYKVNMGRREAAE